MKRKSAYRVLAALVALAMFVVGCSSDKKTDTAAAVSSSPALGSGGAADFVALGGWQDPACSASQPKVTVGISEPIDIAGTSLKDYVDGTQAAVERSTRAAASRAGAWTSRCATARATVPRSCRAPAKRPRTPAWLQGSRRRSW